jgi:hypothetical protein
MINMTDTMELPIEWAALPNQKIIGQVSGDDETCR